MLLMLSNFYIDLYMSFCTASIVAPLPGFHAYGDWEGVAHVVFSFLNTTIWFCLNWRAWRVPPLHNGPGETSPVISLCPVIGDGMFPHSTLPLLVALSVARGAAEPREITSTAPFHGLLCALFFTVVISRDVVALCLQGGLYSSPSHCILVVYFLHCFY